TPLPSPATPPRTSRIPANNRTRRGKVPSAPLKQLPVKYIKKRAKKGTAWPTRRSERLVQKWIKKEI
ncbi:unnamed protein product, partial [Ostreobium quekettii]